MWERGLVVGLVSIIILPVLVSGIVIDVYDTQTSLPLPDVSVVSTTGSYCITNSSGECELNMNLSELFSSKTTEGWASIRTYHSEYVPASVSISRSNVYKIAGADLKRIRIGMTRAIFEIALMRNATSNKGKGSSLPVVVINLDVSPSMNFDMRGHWSWEKGFNPPARIKIAKKDIENLIRGGPAAYYGLTVFSETPRTVVKPTKNKTRILEALHDLPRGSGTCVADGVRNAINEVIRYSENKSVGDKYVITLTDGCDCPLCFCKIFTSYGIDRIINLANKNNVHLIFVGIGKDKEYCPGPLKKAANKTGGLFLEGEDISKLLKALETAISYSSGFTWDAVPGRGKLYIKTFVDGNEMPVEVFCNGEVAESPTVCPQTNENELNDSFGYNVTVPSSSIVKTPKSLRILVGKYADVHLNLYLDANYQNVTLIFSPTPGLGNKTVNVTSELGDNYTFRVHGKTFVHLRDVLFPIKLQTTNSTIYGYRASNETTDHTPFNGFHPTNSLVLENPENYIVGISRSCGSGLDCDIADTCKSGVCVPTELTIVLVPIGTDYYEKYPRHLIDTTVGLTIWLLINAYPNMGDLVEKGEVKFLLVDDPEMFGSITEKDVKDDNVSVYLKVLDGIRKRYKLYYTNDTDVLINRDNLVISLLDYHPGGNGFTWMPFQSDSRLSGWYIPSKNIVMHMAYSKELIPTIPVHELGHQFSLTDEYNYLINGWPNPLMKSQGCDVNGGCCFEKCKKYDDVCCKGNLNGWGGRSIMSYSDVNLDKEGCRLVRSCKSTQCILGDFLDYLSEDYPKLLGKQRFDYPSEKWLSSHKKLDGIILEYSWMNYSRWSYER